MSTVVAVQSSARIIAVVVALALSGSLAGIATPVQASDSQPAVSDSVVYRLAGTDRYATAIEGSKFAFAEGAAGSVVLARGDSFADALPGGALATAVDGPLLLTTPTALLPNTLAEIKRVLPAGGTVYLLGGTGALSTAVETSVKSAGFVARRAAGLDRYRTSLAIAARIEAELGAPAAHLFVATGLNFPDGLSAAAAAAAYNYWTPDSPGVVVLSSGDWLTDEVFDYVWTRYEENEDASVTAVGGPAALAVEYCEDYLVFCIVGDNRYETAAELAYWEFPPELTPVPPGVLGFGAATGTNFPDALSGSALLGRYNYPLLLVAPTLVPVDVADYIDYLTLYADNLTGLVFGGTAVVAPSTADALCGYAAVSDVYCDIAP